MTNKELFFIENTDNCIKKLMFEEIKERSRERNTYFQIFLDDNARFEIKDESCYKWVLYYDYIRIRRGFSR